MNRRYISADLPSQKKLLIIYRTFMPQLEKLSWCNSLLAKDQLTIHVWDIIRVSVETLHK